MDTLSVSRLVLFGLPQLRTGIDNTAVQHMCGTDGRLDTGDAAY
jgi:hypothetical protein